MAKLKRYFGYKKDGEQVYPDETSWSWEEWNASADKGPWIKPLRDLIVLQQDPYPTRKGAIFFPSEGAMEHVLHPGTVLAAGPGTYSEDGTFVENPLKPGDRVAAIRFVAYNRMPDDRNQRMRIVPGAEIWGHVDEEG